MNKKGYVYILTNFNKTVLYTGITTNLKQRLQEHKEGSERASKFATKYKCKYLIYYEEYEFITQAIEREKQIKNWHRDAKIELIQRTNPEMMDLSESIG